MELETDDRQLVEAAQRDPARFAELYERHFERVYAFTVRRVRDRSAAEDLTSEVFHAALANIRQFEFRGAPFGAWLVRIASNAIADRWERLAKERGTPAPEPVTTPAAGDEDTALLYRLVRRLPPDQRQVIMGRFVNEQSIREVARELQKSEGAVKQLQVRAMETLRRQMSDTNG